MNIGLLNNVKFMERAMIKLTEIFEHPKAYDPNEERISKSFGLREIYVNPKFIIYAKRDEVMTSWARTNQLVEGLHRDTQITDLYVSAGQGREKRFSIVGAPSLVAAASPGKGGDQ